MGQTISERILSQKVGRPVHAGDLVVCPVDLVVGTDASGPMAIDYFEQMNGSRVFDPTRVIFALDHYAPATVPETRRFHDRVHRFAAEHGIECLNVGEGIGHQVLVDRHRIVPGELVVGADSHTVTCGALNTFAVGVGSSDLAAAMLTGQIWLRVPETIRVSFEGGCASGVSAKDVGLAIISLVGADGADYQAVEWTGPGLAALSIDDRLVLSNLAVEMGAKVAIAPVDDCLRAWGVPPNSGVRPDPDARYHREITLDLSRLAPQIAKPHDPCAVVSVTDAAGTPIDMVFIGTCTGGRASDFREVLRVLELAGGRLAPGVSLVLTPASAETERALVADGTYARLRALGAEWTMAGCGACCGTSGVIPKPGSVVLSTANRNFKARMGEPTASIYLASPAVCAAAAAAGRIVGLDWLGREKTGALPR